MNPKSVSAALIVAFATLAGSAGARAQGYTTRIETRPFYGAVVTLEHGVRVIRPLPPTRQVIINPNNTPLSLGFNETRVYENRVVRHRYEGGAAQATPRYVSGGGIYGGGFWGGPGHHHRRSWGPGIGHGHRMGGVR